MTIRLLPLLCVGLLSGALGCGDSTTGAMVWVRSDLPEDAIDEVRVLVVRGSEPGRERVAAVGPGGVDFPIRVPLRHEAGALGPVTVTVTGTGPGGLSVSGGADAFYFIRGEMLTIPVTLSAACAGVSCSTGERCVDGSCVPIVEPDAGVDPVDQGMVSPDAGPDMGMCLPAGCDCVLDDCVGVNCDCTAGCECALSCPPGADCDHLHCKDSSCTIDAEDAGDVAVHCDGAQCTSVNVRGTSNTVVKCDKDDSCCIVDCTGASNCFVDCKEGAYCRVDCTGASNCGFRGMRSCWAEDNPLDCGGGVQVCGRGECPPDAACYPGVEPD